MNTIVSHTAHYSPEELERDRQIIAAAREWSEERRHVHERTPEFGVLLRHAGCSSPEALATDWDSRSRWFMLTQFTHPRNAFQTACPSWCTLAADGIPHEDSIDLDTGNQVTGHHGAALETSDGSLTASLSREDRLVDGEVVSNTRVSLSMSDDIVRLSAWQLRQAAGVLAAAANLLDAAGDS